MGYLEEERGKPAAINADVEVGVEADHRWAEEVRGVLGEVLGVPVEARGTPVRVRGVIAEVRGAEEDHSDREVGHLCVVEGHFLMAEGRLGVVMGRLDGVVGSEAGVDRGGVRVRLITRIPGRRTIRNWSRRKTRYPTRMRVWEARGLGWRGRNTGSRRTGKRRCRVLLWLA